MKSMRSMPFSCSLPTPTPLPLPSLFKEMSTFLNIDFLQTKRHLFISNFRFRATVTLKQHLQIREEMLAIVIFNPLRSEKEFNIGL